MEKRKKRSDCPVSNTLEILGDKWSLLIVRDLMYKKKCTYGDFLKSSEGIATNILAAKLIKLEESKIIKKQAHPDSKVKVLYTLTNKGIELLPTMIEMSLWAEKYFDLSAEWRSILETVKKDKTAFLKNLTDKLKAENGG